MLPWIKSPFVLGSPVAGEVVEVGEGGDAARLFKPGDRVVGHAVGPKKRSNKGSEGAYQQYTVLRSSLAVKIPDNLPAAGYEVFATASPKNFEYVRKLGASQVFDYRDRGTVQKMIEVLKNKTCAGALAIGVGSSEASIDVVAAVPGRKFVSQATIPLDLAQDPGNFLSRIGAIMGLISWNISMAIKAKFKGVTTKFVWVTDLMADEVGKMIYNEFLPAALPNGSYKANPDPQIVGSGFESIQQAMNVYEQGVSVRMIVVNLQGAREAPK
ncbi:hypothetical protein AAE478_004155 [Parahypoxylon ruwenzoriense]